MVSRRQQILASRSQRQPRQQPGSRRPAPRRAPGGRRPAPRRGGKGGGFESSPMPLDSQAGREGVELGFERDEGLADLSGRRRSEQEQSGLGEFANNPYSDAALLKRQRDIGQRGVLTGASNQLYAGSTVNAEAQVAGQYDQQQKGLEASDAQAEAAYQRNMGGINRDYELGLGKIKEGAINRALESEPVPLAVPTRRVVRRTPSRGAPSARQPRRPQPRGRRRTR